MKLFIFTSVCITLLFSCQPKEQYLLEDTILECFKAQYATYGIDVFKSIDSANAVLVDHGVLPDVSGKSFIKLIKDVRDSDGFPFDPTTELVSAIDHIQDLPSGINCSDSTYIMGIDTTEIYNSKLMYILEIVESATQSGDISVKAIANDLLQAFDEKDFDHPYYSTLGTIMLCSFVKIQDEMGSFSILPPSTIDDTDLPDSPGVFLEISAIEGDEILVNEDKTAQSELLALIQKFIEKNEPSGIIRIKSHRNVSYRFFVEILDDVNLAYTNYHNAKSLSKYELPYSDLTPEQQKEIRSAYPKKITIVEPDR